METEPSIGLFENEREANLSSTVAMVEDVLVELGHFLNECRVDTPASEATGVLAAAEHRDWRVVKGSASIRITLINRDDFLKLRVVAPVLTTNDAVDTAALYLRLLQLNNDAVFGAAFAVKDTEVLLASERSTLDLDRSEVLDLIRRVVDYTDYYDDKLVAEFGGTLGGARPSS